MAYKTKWILTYLIVNTISQGECKIVHYATYIHRKVVGRKTTYIVTRIYIALLTNMILLGVIIHNVFAEVLLQKYKTKQNKATPTNSIIVIALVKSRYYVILECIIIRSEKKMIFSCLKSSVGWLYTFSSLIIIKNTKLELILAITRGQHPSWTTRGTQYLYTHFHTRPQLPDVGLAAPTIDAQTEDCFKDVYMHRKLMLKELNIKNYFELLVDELVAIIVLIRTGSNAMGMAPREQPTWWLSHYFLKGVITENVNVNLDWRLYWKEICCCVHSQCRKSLVVIKEFDIKNIYQS